LKCLLKLLCELKIWKFFSMHWSGKMLSWKNSFTNLQESLIKLKKFCILLILIGLGHAEIVFSSSGSSFTPSFKTACPKITTSYSQNPHFLNLTYNWCYLPQGLQYCSQMSNVLVSTFGVYQNVMYKHKHTYLNDV